MQNDIFSGLPSGSLFTVSWRGSRRPERREADQAHALEMGEMYYFGQGAEQNLTKAAKWFRKAASAKCTTREAASGRTSKRP